MKKKTLLAWSKFALLVLCSYHFGLFSLISDVATLSSKGDEFTTEQFLAMEKDLRGRIENARQDPTYDIASYFQDLKDIRTRYGRTSYLVGQLQEVARTRSSDDEIMEASRMFAAQNDPTNPGEESREEFKQEVGSFISNLTFGQIADVYFLFLPWSIALLMIWSLQGSREKYFFRNPISFILSAAFYPVVIGYTFVTWLKLRGREVALATELVRRREKFFTLFSQDEVREIKRFAKTKLSFKDWRQHLNNQGLKRRHSLAVSFLIALAMLTLVRPLAVSEVDFSLRDSVIVSHTVEDGGNHEGGVFNSDGSGVIPIIPDFDVLCELYSKKQLYWIRLRALCLRGFARALEPIPLYAVNSFNFYLLTKIKGNNHENNNSSSLDVSKSSNSRSNFSFI